MDGLIAYTTNFIEHHPDDGEALVHHNKVPSDQPDF